MERELKRAFAAQAGYLAIFAVGLLLCLGVYFECKRQYLVAWQHHLESQQDKFKDYSMRVENFFSTLNDNLGTLSSLPSVRKIDRHGLNPGADGRDTILQVCNNLVKNIEVARIYITPVDFDPSKLDATTGRFEQPTLTLDQHVLGSRVLFKSSSLNSSLPRRYSPTAPSSETWKVEFPYLRKQVIWFKGNYPNIGLLKTLAVPMISGREIPVWSSASEGIDQKDADKSGLIFSVPYYDENGNIAGSVSAVISSRVIDSVAGNQNYTLVSPLAEFISAPLARDNNLRMMSHASEKIPGISTIFSDVLVIETNDVRGKWQLLTKYPVADYYSGPQFKAILYFEAGSYAALILLTLAGFGWHRSNQKRAWDMKKNALALQGVNNDISKLNVELAENMKKLHAAQDEIIKKGRLAQMGQLVATVAHELRNPLSAVRTSAFLLRRKLANLPVSVDTQLQRIDNSVARCDAVITQFLDYAKSHHVEFSEHDFDDWIVKTVEDEAQKLPPDVAVECHLGLNGLGVSFDQSRLSRAIINLLSNASEAMVGKGDDPAKFACKLPKIVITTRLAGDRIEIDVCDNGPGISEENVGKIFEPLFTTKNFGTGLGLPAVGQVLEQHGGGLTVKGGLGTGATFTAWLPLSRKQIKAA